VPHDEDHLPNLQGGQQPTLARWPGNYALQALRYHHCPPHLGRGRRQMNGRYLFLDIDGVLNSDNWWASQAQRNARWRYPHTAFDPAAVRRVNALVRGTGASVVLSSSWRRGLDSNAVRMLLRSVGIRCHLAGLTPVLTPDWPHPRPHDQGVVRGDEVAAWLLGSGHTVTSYAILDDDDDFFDPLRQRLVHTSAEVGMTEADMRKALEYLWLPAPRLLPASLAA
jgi:HAD domain in Swiss Army Knife RNA repair proteins